MLALQLIFWVSIGLLIYTYFGYPLVLALVAGFRRSCPPPTPEEWPTVSMIVPAHNEELVIQAKIDNTRGLDYPRGKLELIIASDCSTDATHEIVQRNEDEMVKLVVNEQRGGQTAAQHSGVRVAKGEILVFSDANSMYERDALKKLVRHYADERVGAVVGRLVYANPDSSVASYGESLYWRYEAWLKRLQSKAGALVLGNGAIHSIRRCAHRFIDPRDSYDTMMPILAMSQGFRVVYEPEAVAREPASVHLEEEYKRKARIVITDFRTYVGLRFLLWPPRLWMAFNLISHKVLRHLAFIPMALAFGTCVALGCYSGFYLVILVLQAVFYSIAAVGWLVRERPRQPLLLKVPLYFVTANAGLALGIWRILRGERTHIWEKVEETRQIRLDV